MNPQKSPYLERHLFALDGELLRARGLGRDPGVGS